MRRVSATLAAVGWALLGLLALAGVTISALVAYASTSAGRRAVASTAIKFVDAQVAGRLALGSVELRPGGALAIHDFEAYDPDGQLVLQVDRLVIGADVRRLRNKVVGVDVELDGAAILVNEDAQGRLSLLRAFEPAHPSPRAEPARKSPWPWRDPLSGWTIRLGRLALRGTSLWWQDASGNTRVETQDLAADARAILGPGRGRAEVSLRGQVLSPVPGALVFQLRAQLDHDALQVSVLRAQVGKTRLDALAQADLGKRTGRAALTRATLVRDEARGVVKSTPAGANLSLEAYAEADGRVATGALHVAAEAAGGTGGGSDLAAAVRLDGSRAAGFDLAMKALDPAALVATLPAGNLTLSARGGVAGETMSSLRGNLDLALDPSRLRGGEVGPASVVLRVDRGSWNVSRLSLAAPGLHVEGAGTYQQGGTAAAAFTAEIADLARAGENAGRLLGRRLPALSGRARVETRLSGTAAAPVIAARVASPALGVASTSAAGIEAQVDASGPFRPGALRIQARVQRLASGGRVVAHDLVLDGALAPMATEPGAATATLAASGLVPSLGTDPVSVQAAATLPRERRTLRLTELAIAYPGTRYALQDPATLIFEGPRVDRLALVSGPQLLAVEGGIGPRRSLDARVQVVRLDLLRLPAGLLPEQVRIAGEVTADARATGTLDRPNLDATLEVQGGGFRTEQALTVKGTVRYQGTARRVAVQLAVARGPGGALDLEADLPVPFRGRSAEPVSATVRADGMPIPALLELAGAQAPVTGRLGANLQLRGTAGAPALRAQVTVAEGSFRDLSSIALDATADLAAAADATVEVRLSGEQAIHVAAHAPFSMAALLADPGRAVKGLRQARISADASIPGLELATLSGRLGVPSGLRGRIAGEVHAAGTPGALRGTAALSVAELAYAGYTGIAARIESTVRDDRIEARISAQLQGSELLQLTAMLRAPPERLVTRAGLDAAEILVDATVPGVDLERAAGPSGVAIGYVVYVFFDQYRIATVGRFDDEGGAADTRALPVDQAVAAMATRQLPEALPEPGPGASPYAAVHVGSDGDGAVIRTGSVVIAAITSCTNTSNPTVMVGAGLLARNAVARGLAVPETVKTSLAPGSRAVTAYLEAAGLMKPLERLGFELVGYGCTTCIGNSGPLDAPVARAIEENDLTVAAVLSGNRNFEGRIHPLARVSYLASPPLVVAFALAGRVDIDLTREPVGRDSQGRPVMLDELWPSADEIRTTIDTAIDPELFRRTYASVFEGDDRWRALPIPSGDRYAWDPESTYVARPPFFEGLTAEASGVTDIEGARALAVLGDSVTTDHISPAGTIAATSPAGQWLQAHGVGPLEFNSYGSRRGHHEVMMRGTFANIRLRNRLVEREGPYTAHQPSGDEMFIYDAAMRYASEGVPLIVIGGREYGSGSSRDWAAKGTALLGVRAVLAESYERIHRSNLVGMGVLPLQFVEGENAASLGLTGTESFSVRGLADGLGPRQEVQVEARAADGTSRSFRAIARLDGPIEVDYYREGGILPAVLRRLARESAAHD